MSKPYHDGETLDELYNEQRMGIQEIADKFDVSTSTIHDWMERNGVERRNPGTETSVNPPNMNLVEYEKDGGYYEVFRCNKDGAQDFLGHHRLLAVAEYGWDEVVGKDVHHVNGITWLNYPDNLVPLPKEVHMKHHSEELDRDEGGAWVEQD